MADQTAMLYDLASDTLLLMHSLSRLQRVSSAQRLLYESHCNLNPQAALLGPSWLSGTVNCQWYCRLISGSLFCCCPAPQIPFQVDIVRGCVDNDSIGALVCRRAEQMEAVVVLMAKHSRGPIKEFFIGSVTNYAAHHCKQPVLVLHCD
eukprot:GHUV01035209.1.p1 GENE.GHUV01035209.1~~GHUV01035209.1.p1  ORF type:complete len:149 (-),score=21.80 GHUV01035209.1:55-501(-)